MRTAVIALVAVLVAGAVGFTAGGALGGGDEELGDTAKPVEARDRAIPVAPAGPSAPPLRTASRPASGSRPQPDDTAGDGPASPSGGARDTGPTGGGVTGDPPPAPPPPPAASKPPAPAPPPPADGGSEEEVNEE